MSSHVICGCLCCILQHLPQLGKLGGRMCQCLVPSFRFFCTLVPVLGVRRSNFFGTLVPVFGVQGTSAKTTPVSPYPLNLGGAISPLNFGGGVSEAPCFIVLSGDRPLDFRGEMVTLVAQCSATPATVAATPPCSATPFQTTKSRCDTSRHSRGGRGGATPKFLGGVARHPCYTCKTL